MSFFKTYRQTYTIPSSKIIPILAYFTEERIWHISSKKVLRGTFKKDNFRIRSNQYPDNFNVYGTVTSNDDQAIVTINGAFYWPKLILQICFVSILSMLTMTLSFLLLKEVLFQGIISLTISCLLTWIFYHLIIGRIRKNYLRTIDLIERFIAIEVYTSYTSVQVNAYNSETFLHLKDVENNL